MLTRTFLKNLSTKAHQLNPVVLIGAKGLTCAVHEEVEVALLAHELIKIKISSSSRELKQAIIIELAKKHNATIVQQIGHVLVLYRENPKNKKH